LLPAGSGWGTEAVIDAVSPGGGKLLISGTNGTTEINANGSIVANLPVSGPGSGTATIYWSAVNDEGDAVGYTSLGWRGWWDQANGEVHQLTKPAAWGTDGWNFLPGLTNDLTVIALRIETINGASILEPYLFNLESGEIIAKMALPPEGGYPLAMGEQGHATGWGLRPWISLNGQTPALLSKLMIATSATATPVILGDTGWTITGVERICASGTIVLSVTLPSGGGRAVAVLYDNQDKDQDGVPDDRSVSLTKTLMAAFDSNHDGNLDATELAVYHAQFPDTPQAPDPNVDHDGDGYTLSEETQRGSSDADPTNGGDTRDTDHDGIPDVQDADPNDRVVNWKIGPRPDFAICKLPVDASHGTSWSYQYLDPLVVGVVNVSAHGDVLYTLGGTKIKHLNIGGFPNGLDEEYNDSYIARVTGENLKLAETTPGPYPGFADVFKTPVPVVIDGAGGANGYAQIHVGDGAPASSPMGTYSVNWSTANAVTYTEGFIYWDSTLYNFDGDCLRTYVNKAYYNDYLFSELPNPGDKPYLYQEYSFADAGFGALRSDKQPYPLERRICYGGSRNEPV
jgi:hypothetical protein